MNASDHDTQNTTLVDWVWIHQPVNSNAVSSPTQSIKIAVDVFRPLRNWLDQVEVKNPKLARSLCKWIPSQCPFEREVKVRSRIILKIPPLCKLNPLYDEVVALRFRALCYLADVCGEDISAYC